MMTKQELLQRLAEILPDDGRIEYATVTVTIENEYGSREVFHYDTETNELT